MDLSTWALYALLAAGAVLAVIVHYRRNEPAGTGRVVLVLVRSAVLALILLLLFDPVVPAGTGDDRSVALVDASLSMTLGNGSGTRWDAARREVGGLDGGRVLLFGAGEARPVAGLEAVEPDAVGSRLAPALRAALESGADRVVVVTDGAVDDRPEAARIARAYGGSLELRTVGGATTPNLSLVEVTVPGWLEPGEEAALGFEVGRVGEAAELPDSATVVLSQEGREIARSRVPVPSAGRTSAGRIRFRPESVERGVGDPLRLDVEVRPGGSASDDDIRSRYVRIAEEPAGVALVSFRPDQEPRFLLPVLERALGVPVRGWLALPGDRYIRLGTGPTAGESAEAAAVRRGVGRAGLVVLHGLSEDGPGWARQRATEAPRLLLFPADPVPAGVGASPGPARSGEWYPIADLPPSPVAALLVGIDPGGTPPLVSLRGHDSPQGFWAPVLAREGRRGEAEPVLVAGTVNGRRVAVALGSGYWRWAFAGPEGRALYDRLWSAVAGWLLEDVEAAGVEVLRPESRVVARGAPVGWVVPPGLDSVRVALTRDTITVDTTVAVVAGRASTGVLPPGHYRYELRGIGEGGPGRAGPAGDTESSEASEALAVGPLTVESYSRELTRAAVALDLESGEDETERRGIARTGRPLRTTPWPYLLIVGLLCAEWVLRRRWGLR